MMELIGYLLSVFIGISLGLVGSGGSILTVPVLVYLMGVSPVMATAYSLFVVGTTSLVGVWPKYREGYVDFRTAVVFGIPSILAVFLIRRFVMPVLPEQVFSFGTFPVSKDLFLMLVFALLMLGASISMIRDRTAGSLDTDETDLVSPASQKRNYPYLWILIEGLIVGGLTGLVGAGGGFLIIPALVLLCRLPIKTAIGTSLLIIASKSLIGFAGDLSQHTDMDWNLLSGVTGAAVLGMFIGNFLSRRIDGQKLKKGFGWFVLVMGIYIIITELIKQNIH